MSSGRPRMLAPELPVREAIEQMRRWGHEGFPVVASSPAGGDTAAGRADAARGGPRAGSRAGRPAGAAALCAPAPTRCAPEDSICRRCAADHDREQLGPDSRGKRGRRHCRHRHAHRSDQAVGRALPRTPRREIARRLRRALARCSTSSAEVIGARWRRCTYAVYVVGGFVRDLMLGVTSQRALTLDVDIVIEGDAISLCAAHAGALWRARRGAQDVWHRQVDPERTEEPVAPGSRC
jgi:tRNA nucleotidyltransferase (CCA-adding enzyme)